MERLRADIAAEQAGGNTFGRHYIAGVSEFEDGDEDDEADEKDSMDSSMMTFCRKEM